MTIEENETIGRSSKKRRVNRLRGRERKGKVVAWIGERSKEREGTTVYMD